MAHTDSGGPGPVLLCLHAIGHGARDFDDLSRRLSSQYRVIALDFPNHDGSGVDSRAASGSRYTEILSQFIEWRKLELVVLLGNSIGAAVSIRYSGWHPERVKAIVLCDSGGLGPPDRVERIFIWAFAQFFAAGRRGAVWFPWAFKRYYRKVLVTESARKERERIIRSGYEVAPVLEQAWRSFARPEENLAAFLPRIKCPVLLAWAKGDIIIQMKRSVPSFEKIPDHRLKIFERGHAAFLEDPDRFQKVVRRFLEEKLGKKSAGSDASTRLEMA